jgi:diadenylate cyclase
MEFFGIQMNPTSGWIHLVEVAVLAAILFVFIRMVRGPRLLQMVIGLGAVLVVFLTVRWIGLMAGGWLATGFATQLVLIMAILFQQEIRRALVQIGRMAFSSHSLSAMDESRTLEEIIRAVFPLAEERIGAILVLERESELWDIVELGVPLDAKVTRELLTSIFLPQSPLHDGAVVIRKDRVVAAGCFLPLNLDPDLGRMLGTRHRAALGITEESDAVVVTVSGETGAVSAIMAGNMVADLDPSSLRKLLTRLFLKEHHKAVDWSDRIKAFLPLRSK